MQLSIISHSISIYLHSYYCIAENVSGRKHWRIWWIDLQSPKFSSSKILSLSFKFYGELDLPRFVLQTIRKIEFANVFSRQRFSLYSTQVQAELGLRYVVTGSILCLQNLHNID